VVRSTGAIRGAVRVEGSGIGAVGNGIQAVSGAIAICDGYADNLSIWMRQSGATALAVASIVKLGVTPRL
jgi:hypothetical protein